jgi:phosphatidylglycerophosphatase A
MARHPMMRLALLVCTVCGVGYSPIAPGTAGSLAGLIVYAIFRAAGVGPIGEGIALVVICLAGAWSGTLAERHFGTTDPGPGVIDEVAGMLITLYLLPATWMIAGAGFLIFRVLDVLKPFPARRLESLRGGWGMMADDVMVAVYANLILRAAVAVAPGLFLS